MFLGVMDENESNAIFIELRPPSTPHHLQDIRDREIYIALALPVKILCPLYDDEMSREIDAPSEGGSGNQNLENKNVNWVRGSDEVFVKRVFKFN